MRPATTRVDAAFFSPGSRSKSRARSWLSKPPNATTRRDNLRGLSGLSTATADFDPSAVVPHAGICAGGRPKGRSLPRPWVPRPTASRHEGAWNFTDGARVSVTRHDLPYLLLGLNQGVASRPTGLLALLSAAASSSWRILTLFGSSMLNGTEGCAHSHKVSVSVGGQRPARSRQTAPSTHALSRGGSFQLQRNPLWTVNAVSTCVPQPSVPRKGPAQRRRWRICHSASRE